MKIGRLPLIPGFRFYAVVYLMFFWISNCLPAQDVVFDQKKISELVRKACDSDNDAETRAKAIQELARADEWQSLGRVLVWVTREHTKILQIYNSKNPKNFIQNVNNIQALPIPESFLIGELVRIGNPGAIAYLKQYWTDRHRVPYNPGGETNACFDAAIESLEVSLLRWEPFDTSEKN